MTVSNSVSGPIDVLLADDDPDWARFTATEMEAASSTLSVHVVETGTAAVDELRGEGSYDCLMADYQMPGMDGLEVLDAVRDTHPDLPVVLVTGAGDETVAAEAIERGVTDYVVKEPLENQGPGFASRVERAVETHRLRTALEESERRYRTVVEQSHDAMAIVQEGRLVFYNERLKDLTGCPDDALDGRPLTDVIHAEDTDRVETVFEGRTGTDSAESVKVDVRITRGPDDVRECEFNCTNITYEGTRGTLCSIRDLTVRKRRERELERALNLNSALQHIAVQSRTRNDVALAFCRRLIEDPGRRFAWVGDRENGGPLEPQVVAGSDDGYLEAIPLDDDHTTATTPPSVVAATTRDPQFVTDLSTEPAAPWQEHLTDRGIASVAALPLVHDDVSYGVLAVYATESAPFEETERQLLVAIADTLSATIERAELRTALTADRVVEVQLRLSRESHYLFPLARTRTDSESGTTIEVLATIPHDETGVWQFLSVTSGETEAIASQLANQSQIRSIDRLDATAEQSGFRVHVDEPTPESLLGDYGGLVRSTVVSPTAATVDVEFPETADVRSVVDALEQAFGPVSLERYQKREIERERSTVLDRCDLTDKQSAALRTAYRYGYFQDTRQHYADEIADALGVSRPTFQRHLRVAQRKVFGELLEGDRSVDG